ncbi:MAG: beta-galactosidase [Planctomycetota bacterium]
MNKTNSIVVFMASILFGATLPLWAEGQAQSLTLFSFDKGFDISEVITTDAKATLTKKTTLHIETGTKQNWPGITLKAPAGRWDLSKYEYITVDIKNIDAKPVTVFCRVDNPGADGRNKCVTDSITLNPNSAETLTVRLYPTTYQLSEPVELIGMRRAPALQGKLDASNVTQLLMFVTRPKAEHVFEIDNICAGGCVKMLNTKTFFPFIDEFGQFIHKDWPGKTHSQEELIAHGKVEEKDLAANPIPTDRNKYGGWIAGWKLKATGFFRVQKFKNKWWLVDPQGRLFWSHGIDCVRSANATPITDREHYYRNLPKADSLFSTFYGRGSWAPHGYYKDHSPYRTYDFSQANFLRKYGPEWQQKFADITHRRLKSWGINTIANWSQDNIYLMRKTPYVATISYNARRLEGSQGYWGKFYDVFDPSFCQTSASDPWCVGYFVHNELSWGDETSLAVAALISPPEQPAKKVFIKDLKGKYKSIDNLNNAWGTNHKTWDALLQSTQAPDKKKAHDDLTAFYTKIAETYFKIIREEVKKVAPNQLYMGCRFAWVNDRAARAATKFCDIISYNRYSYSVENHRLPDGIDMPVIIGEFHFGALDRGMFHTGLRKTANQQDRADKYKSYVQGALRNPYIVGTHWFQYKDQATTGRGDGENYQIGFIDICDKPYPETIKACRQVGYTMYEYRLNNP